MASTEDRVRQLVRDNLEVDGKPLAEPVELDTGLSDVGVSSMDIVAFAKLVAQEFNVNFTPEDCANLTTLRGLVEYLDSQAA